MGRRVALILLAVQVVGAGIAGAQVQQLTSDALIQDWSNRFTTTSQGKVLITDGTDVSFFDGTSVSLVQAQGSQGPESQGVVESGSLFVLGSASTPGQVVAMWRRGTDFAWVWVYDGGPPPFPLPVLVQATNPTTPGQPMNPEGGAVDGGCAFLALQDGFCPGNCRQVYLVDTTTGVATNLTGNAPVFGFTLPMTASRRQGVCQAAWGWDDGTGTPQVQFFDGSTVIVVDSGGVFGPNLSDGRLVYQKTDGGGIDQVMLYDSTQPSPTPVPLTADVAGANDFARTDGRHVAWFHTEAATRDIVLAGGLSLTAADPTSRPNPGAFGADALLLDRGQLLWQDVGGVLRHYNAAGPRTIEIAPATTVNRPWIADGYVTWLGLSNDAGPDPEVFLFSGTPPSDASQPAPPLLVRATPGANQAALAWDQVLGATSYNLYLAEEPGVNSTNYPTLRGGRRIVGVTSPFVVTSLGDNRSFHFVVTALEGAAEGPVSREAQATLIGPATWVEVGSFGTTPFTAVAADPLDGSVAYAAAGGLPGPWHTYKSTDGGFNWAPLGGLIDGIDVRAFAVTGPRILAASRQGNMFRSTDGGGSWVQVVTGIDIGEQKKSLAVDPNDPNVLYAGDFQLAGSVSDYLIKSTDGGVTWAQLPDTPLGEIRAYALVVNAFSHVYAGGTGSPLLRSLDGGATWSAIAPAPGYYWSADVDPGQPATLFVGHSDFSYTTHEVSKTTSNGASWTTTGTPEGLPADQVISLKVDAGNPDYVHAGTYSGYAYSIDAGASWIPLNGGLTPQSVNDLAVTAAHRVVAGTYQGLYLLDLAVAPSANLGVGVTDAPDPVNVGGTLTYTITVTNAGPDPASNVTLVDTLPPGVNFVSSNPPSPTCTLAAQVLTCALGSLPINGTSVVSVVVSPTAPGMLTNNVSVSASEADPDASNNTASATTTVVSTPLNADLGVGVTDAPDPVTVGSNLTYTATVTNAGPDPASAVTLVDALPGSVTFVSSTPPSPTCNLAGSTLTCALGNLGNGGSTVVTVVVTPTAPGTLTSTLTVSGAEPDPNPANNTAVATTTATAPLPSVSIGDASVTEGNSGTVNATFVVSLSASSASPVTVAYATASGTATSGTDFLPAAGTLTLAPGTTSAPLVVQVVGDVQDEPDENFFVNLSSPTGANLGDAQGLGMILDDDGGVTVVRELTHGSQLVADLAADPGPVADVDLYAINQRPRSSYEILVDGTSGDLGSSGPLVERLGPGGTSVVQTSVPAGAGASRSLRWENATAATVADESVRVQSGGCTTDCDAADVYRISAFDTTGDVPRFNNSATQVSVVVLQNLSTEAVTGHLWFRGASGAFLASATFSMPPRGSFVLNSSSLVPGASGSITVTSNARYGALLGKAVAVEPGTGFTFDTAMQPRWK